MKNDEKNRWLAEQAGWLLPDAGVQHGYPPGGLDCVALPDYPNSLDAIARDLLPLLREKGMDHEMRWLGDQYRFLIWPSLEAIQALAICDSPEPARAAFEAIWQALGGEE